MKRLEKLWAAICGIDALSLRERLAVFFALVFVIGGLWEATVGGPLAERKADAREKIAATEGRLAVLQESVELAAHGVGGGMSEQLRRLDQLRRSVADGEESMRVFTSDLVDPEQMRFVIEDLLEQHAGLELVAARNIPARPVLTEDEVLTADDDEPVLFRHGVLLEFEGGYLESLRYLEDIERLPWRLFWSQLRLDSSDYPSIQIAVLLQTLSLNEEWIGV